VVLWLCTLSGGLVAGAGLFLLLQIRLILYERDQLARISAVERFLGKITFLWRGPDEKLALALGDIPELYLHHSEQVGRWMAGTGLLGVALVLPRILRRRWQR